MRRRYTLGFLALALVLVDLAACTPDGASRLEHNTDNPVVEDTAGLWSRESDDDYVNIVQHISVGAFDPALNKDSYLPPTHPMTMRLQYWADQVDGMLRQRYPGMLDNVPSPRIAVLQTDDINAYVAAMPVCFDNVTVRLGSAAAPAAAGSGAAYQSGAISDARDATQHLVCRHHNASFAELLTHVNHINNTDHVCSLHVTQIDAEHFAVTPSSGCVIDPGLAALGTVASYVVTPTAQHVTVFSGILRTMHEDEMVAVLAHELGHFYHGHAYAPAGRYGYFFHLAGSNSPTQPVAAADMAKLGADFSTAQSEVTRLTLAVSADSRAVALAIHPKINGQKLHTVLFKPLQTLTGLASGLACLPTDAACACNQATSGAPNVTLLRFTMADEGIAGPLTPDEEAAYLAYEASALTCLAGIKIADAPLPAANPAAKTTVVAKNIYALLQATGLGQAAGFLTGLHPAGSVADYLAVATDILNKTYPAYDAQALGTLALSKRQYAIDTDRLAAAEQSIAAFTAQAKQQQLGYFTVEEEADELSAEWLSYLGFNPEIGGDADMVFVKAFEPKAVSDKCAAQRQSQWKDTDGSDVILPWGALDDPHPGGCFRVRNYDKEVLAHGYPTPTVAPSAALQPSWDSLVAMIGGPLTLTLPTEPGATQVRGRQRSLRCRFNR